MSLLHLKFGGVQCAMRLSLSMRNAKCVDVQNYLCGTFGPSANEAHFNRNMEKRTQFHCLYTRVLTFCIMFFIVHHT